jgi:hypothetical protein
MTRIIPAIKSVRRRIDGRLSGPACLAAAISREQTNVDFFCANSIDKVSVAPSRGR